MVPNAQQGKRYQHDDDDGPEVDELGAEDGGVAVCEDDEVVALHVTEGEDDVLPSLTVDDLSPLLDAVAIEGERGIDYGQQDVVEQRLEGRNGCSCGRQQAGEGVCSRDAECQYLPIIVITSSFSSIS